MPARCFLTISGVLVARGLGPEDRGYLALIVVVSGICVILGSAGLPTALTYYVARDPAYAGRIVRLLIAPTTVQVVVISVVQLGVLFAFVMHDPQRVKVAALISILLVLGFSARRTDWRFPLQGRRRRSARSTPFACSPTALYVVVVLAIFPARRRRVDHPHGRLGRRAAHWRATRSPESLSGDFRLQTPLAVRHDRTWPGSGSRASSVLFPRSRPCDSTKLWLACSSLRSPLGLYVVAQAFTNLPRVVAMSIGMIAYPHVASQPDAAVARRAMWRYFLLGVLSAVLGHRLSRSRDRNSWSSSSGANSQVQRRSRGFCCWRHSTSWLLAVS